MIEDSLKLRFAESIDSYIHLIKHTLEIPDWNNIIVQKTNYLLKQFKNLLKFH